MLSLGIQYFDSELQVFENTFQINIHVLIIHSVMLRLVIHIQDLQLDQIDNAPKSTQNSRSDVSHTVKNE